MNAAIMLFGEHSFIIAISREELKEAWQWLCCLAVGDRNGLT